jgi:hypothetical protein
VQLTVQDRTLALRFDSDWLAENPLTVADLEREHDYLQGIGYALQFNQGRQAI